MILNAYFARQARTALADVQLALQTEPSHRLMLEMKARLEQKLKQYEAAQAGHDTASPSKLSTHAASKREAELKATALARRAQEARKKMAQDSPSKDFKAPRTVRGVRRCIARKQVVCDTSFLVLARHMPSNRLWHLFALATSLQSGRLLTCGSSKQGLGQRRSCFRVVLMSKFLDLSFNVLTSTSMSPQRGASQGSATRPSRALDNFMLPVAR